MEEVDESHREYQDLLKRQAADRAEFLQERKKQRLAEAVRSGEAVTVVRADIRIEADTSPLSGYGSFVVVEGSSHERSALSANYTKVWSECWTARCKVRSRARLC